MFIRDIYGASIYNSSSVPNQTVNWSPLVTTFKEYLVWDPSMVYFGCFHIPGAMDTSVSLVPQLSFGHKGIKYRQVGRIASTGIQQLLIIKNTTFRRPKAILKGGNM